MYLKPGFSAEYKKRHDEIWPELSQLLTDAGISNYSIFLDEETNILFAVQSLSPDATSSQELGTNAIVQRWWRHMADIMETEADSNKPLTRSLDEVFHLK
jgi:L-rhamnose mutarotase